MKNLSITLEFSQLCKLLEALVKRGYEINFQHFKDDEETSESINRGIQDIKEGRVYEMECEECGESLPTRVKCERCGKIHRD